MPGLFLILILASQVWAQVPQPAPPDSSDRAWIKLISDRDIGKVWIDSLIATSGPDNILAITAGIHQIRVIPGESENWLIRSFSATIDARANDTLEVRVEFPEFVSVNSKPFGADVRLGATLLGKTPVLVRRDRIGHELLTLSLVGYEEASVSLARRHESSILVSLVPDQEELQEKLQLRQSFLNKKRTDRKLALITLGLSVASGATALWLKDQADKKYDRYRRSGLAGEINTLFDDAKRFDRLSAASYIVFEVNLIASTYFLMRSILRKP